MRQLRSDSTESGRAETGRSGSHSSFFVVRSLQSTAGLRSGASPRQDLLSNGYDRDADAVKHNAESDVQRSSFSRYTDSAAMLSSRGAGTEDTHSLELRLPTEQSVDRAGAKAPHPGSRSFLP